MTLGKVRLLEPQFSHLESGYDDTVFRHDEAAVNVNHTVMLCTTKKKLLPLKLRQDTGCQKCFDFSDEGKWASE